MENEVPAKPKLYTAVVRCWHCLAVLGRKEHTEMNPGTVVEHTKCRDKKHTRILVEWEPE